MQREEVIRLFPGKLREILQKADWDADGLQEIRLRRIFMDSSQKQNLREIRAHGTSIFPCAYYLTTGNFTRLQVKHHWHEEIEILYLKSGKYKALINMESYEIHKECFLFVNRGELHDLRSVSQEYEEQAVVFDPQMLRFYNYDSIDEHILLPLIQGKLTFPRILDRSHPVFEVLAAEYKKISDAN